MPRSICAMNPSVSIASSIVASVGSSRSSSLMRSRMSRSVTIKFYASSPSFTVRHAGWPLGWSQIWSHGFSDLAKYWEISASRALSGLALGAGGRWFESSRTDQLNQRLTARRDIAEPFFFAMDCNAWRTSPVFVPTKAAASSRTATAKPWSATSSRPRKMTAASNSCVRR